MDSALHYVINKIKIYDLLLLGEDHRIKENLEFVRLLIPHLYQHGCTNLGMEFGAYEDQEALDALLTGNQFDRQVARELMFHYNVSWAYKEYLDLYEAAFDFNKTLPMGAKPFRIINLSYIYNWRHHLRVITDQIAKEVFYKGNSEVHRANIVKKEVIEKGEKMVILTGTIHAFTHFNYPVYDYLSPNFVRFINLDFGQLLHSDYQNKVATLLFHQPFLHFKDDQFEYCGPGNSLLEKELMGKENVGFDLLEFDLPDDSQYSMGKTNFTLSQLALGYLFLKPLKFLHGATIDGDFLVHHTLADIQANFPDPQWREVPKTLDDYWNYIKLYQNIETYYKN